MPARLQPAAPLDVAAAELRVAEADSAQVAADAADVGLLVRHYLALLTERAPGRAVEVRVPPYGAVQAVSGGRHTRGKPRAVVETDGSTWLRLASGRLTWAEALSDGRVQASGERSDLSPYLPLVAL